MSAQTQKSTVYWIRTAIFVISLVIFALWLWNGLARGQWSTFGLSSLFLFFFAFIYLKDKPPASTGSK